MDQTVDIAIVGGGIAGLYCALHLSHLINPASPASPASPESPARHASLHIGGAAVDVSALSSVPVHVFEAGQTLGGRIETWTFDFATGLPPTARDTDQGELYRAEFGPMRIEPRDQPLLDDLLKYLGFREAGGGPPSDFDLIAFSPYAADVPGETNFPLHGEEAEQTSLLDLLLLAIRRICELVAEDGEQIPADPGREAARYWRQFLGASSVRRRYWKGELRDWIMNLGNEDYDHIRRNIRINGIYLRDMGFWNLLSEVLSHLAVLRIRDWGSYYHLVSENPNAAEHLVLWLRSIKSTNSLRGIRGGMELLVTELARRLTPDRGVQLHTGRTVVAVEAAHDSSPYNVRLRFGDGAAVRARDVVLALPKRPLEKLDLAPLRQDLDAVMSIPLLKVFFVIDQPWWEDNRPANRFAGDLPTREIHYWKSQDRSKGVLMVYTDRPALQFWTDYLTGNDPSISEDRQDRATTWVLDPRHARSEERLPNRRIWKRFVQYARDYEHHDFTAERLLAVGIRDWGKEPYGGAVFLWRPRRRSWEVMGRLVAFGLCDGERNLHVIGDAYSDHQGFIEGALRSTARLLNFYTSGPHDMDSSKEKTAAAPFDEEQFLSRLRLSS